VSSQSPKPDGEGDGAWVPSPEQPVPPTTEFAAVTPEAVEPISGSAVPDETPAATDAPAPADVPEPAPSAGPGPSPTATPEPAPGAASEAPAPDAPAWKTPAAAGLPPQWGDPSAEDADASGPQPENGVQNLWGLVPEDRPEVLLGVALAGGVLAAILVRTLARR
jgi:hypothetical protein